MTNPPKFQKRKVKGGYEIRYTPRKEAFLFITDDEEHTAEDEAETMAILLNRAWEYGSIDWIRKTPKTK